MREAIVLKRGVDEVAPIAGASRVDWVWRFCLRALAISALSLGPGLCALVGPAGAADDYEPNDALDEAAFLGGPLRDPEVSGALVLTATAELEGGASKDFYSFTAFAGVPIAIRLAPQARDGRRIDGRNLGFRLWRRVSAQTNTFEVLATVDTNPSGLDEYLPPTPLTQAGFLAVEVYASDTFSPPQPYELSISNVEIAPLATPTWTPTRTANVTRTPTRTATSLPTPTPTATHTSMYVWSDRHLTGSAPYQGGLRSRRGGCTRASEISLSAARRWQRHATKPAARSKSERARHAFVQQRLDALASFFELLDAGIAAFTRGSPLEAESLRLRVGGKPPAS
jgi:hypothetical protein